MSPSPIQLLIVGAIIVLLFGASRFSDLGKGLGEGIRNFKKGVSDSEDDPKQAASSDKSESESSETDKAGKSSDA